MLAPDILLGQVPVGRSGGSKCGVSYGVVVLEAHLCVNRHHGNQTGSGIMKGSDRRTYAGRLADAGAIVNF